MDNLLNQENSETTEETNSHTKCYYCDKSIKNEVYEEHFEECEEKNGPPMTVLGQYNSKSDDEFGNIETHTYGD